MEILDAIFNALNGLVLMIGPFALVVFFVLKDTDKDVAGKKIPKILEHRGKNILLAMQILSAFGFLAVVVLATAILVIFGNDLGLVGMFVVGAIMFGVVLLCIQSVFLYIQKRVLAKKGLILKPLYARSISILGVVSMILFVLLTILIFFAYVDNKRPWQNSGTIEENALPAVVNTV